jgi:hypothetical protein
MAFNTPNCEDSSEKPFYWGYYRFVWLRVSGVARLDNGAETRSVRLSLWAGNNFRGSRKHNDAY